MELMRVRLRYKNCLTVSKMGRSGSLALLWPDDINISISSYSSSHIDALITDNIGKIWHFTGFYDNPSTFSRHASWNLLRCLFSQWSGPWIFAGDFNEIISQDEKIGGPLRLFSQMSVFGDALTDCNFFEIPIQGLLMTCSRCRDDGLIMERLDRGVVNSEFFNEFPKVLERHIVKDSSDHLPNLFELFGNKRNSKVRLFRFEHMCLAHEGCKRVVEDNWGRALFDHAGCSCEVGRLVVKLYGF